MNNKLSGKIVSFFFGIFLLTMSCSAKHGMERSFQGVERLHVEVKKEGYALIRGIYCDISIEELDREKWQRISSSKIFMIKDGPVTTGRVPSLIFFQMIIKNTSREVIKVGGVNVRYGDITLSGLNHEGLKKYISSPANKKIDYRKMLQPRRLVTDKLFSGDIDYDRDTIGYGFDFIPPSDTILQISVFDWIPVEIKDFKFIVEFTAAGKNFSSHFDIRRMEFRTRGDVFLQPKQKIEELY